MVWDLATQKQLNDKAIAVQSNWITNRPPTPEEVRDDQLTFVTYLNGDVALELGEYIRDTINYSKSYPQDVIAWQLRPEPYKGN